ncbi:HAD family hydrolase [Oceanobacter sp. 3_MG-2023]|jgi:3-deoxy-D-manno-octulosonate 8-phosphate phosphatase (KDO 8-P phosphatase)|uniref:KdsC family phosphatase n=1 Tax=Oceanobacter sp. 3_MG-2023 TaxID=3062622 RepID=UPI002734D718|nr:HAD-IIIA family hydrolase [Oceanobacter sp. 3_MG-2023]MDP2504147.1 HAD-IIIA family hydrolase [Oceanobacter sp. 3_MG-2023]
MSWTNPLPEALQQRAAMIKLVVFDVDGVLTNGTLTYSGDGELVKHFNVKDGVGIKLLEKFAIATAIISAKSSDALARRARDLGVRHFYPGSKDKWPCLEEVMSQLGITPGQVCYVGDDVIDLKVMTRVGLPMAPADAFWMVQQRAAHVTQAAGGCGVAREVADLILGSQMPLEDAYIKAMLPEFEEQKG